MLDWGQTTALDTAVPAHFVTPMGRKAPIDYDGDHPAIQVRLQEMFGTTRHPTVAGNPLRVELLSPAKRPIQITMDIPNFWKTSYADVRPSRTNFACKTQKNLRNRASFGAGFEFLNPLPYKHTQSMEN